MVWFGDCFSLLIQRSAFDVGIHLRTDTEQTMEARRLDIQFLAGVCNCLARHHASFSWQANLYAMVEHRQLRFRSLRFSLWQTLRCLSRGAFKFLQDNQCLHGNVTFLPVAAWPDIQSLWCRRSSRPFSQVHIAITFSFFRRCKLFLLSPSSASCDLLFLSCRLRSSPVLVEKRMCDRVVLSSRAFCLVRLLYTTLILLCLMGSSILFPLALELLTWSPTRIADGTG